MPARPNPVPFPARRAAHPAASGPTAAAPQPSNSHWATAPFAAASHPHPRASAALHRATVSTAVECLRAPGRSLLPATHFATHASARLNPAVAAPVPSADSPVPIAPAVVASARSSPAAPFHNGFGPSSCRADRAAAGSAGPRPACLAVRSALVKPETHAESLSTTLDKRPALLPMLAPI